MSAPEYCRVAKEEDKASSVSPLAAPSVSNSLEETQLSETDAKVRALSLLNGRGAKEEDEVNPT